MKILLISDFLPPVRGGLENHVHALAVELHRRGDIVHVATLTRRPDPIEGVTIHTVTAWSSHLPHESPDRPFHPPLADPSARRDLRRIISEFAPDVVHAHSWLAASLPKNRPPLVYTAHDYGLFCEVRTLTLPDGSTCAGPGLAKCARCGTQSYPAPVAAVMSPGTLVGRRLLTMDTTVAVSGYVADRLARHLDRRPTVVHNFVPDLQQRASMPDGVVPSGRFAMFAGDPGPHKGLSELVELWAGEQSPPAPLFVATTRPAALAPAPNIAAARLSREAVAAAWRRSTVALVPSRWPDPCPTVVLEAMQAGTPVVAYGVGGVPELLRDGVDGYVIEPGNRAQFKAAVLELLSDRSLADRMGAAARTHAERFSVQAAATSLREIYARAIRGSAGLDLL